MSEDYSWFYTVEPKYKNCTKEEMMEYLKAYPRKIECDMFMGTIAWYDFSTAPYWPEALRIASFNYEYEESDFCICTNAEDVYNSCIQGRWAVYENGKWVKTINGEKVVEHNKNLRGE